MLGNNQCQSSLLLLNYMIHLIYIVSHFCQFCCDFMRPSTHGLSPSPYKTKPYRTRMETSWKSHGNQSFIFLLHHWNPLILSLWWTSPGLIDYWLRCPIASLLLIEFFWKLSIYVQLMISGNIHAVHSAKKCTSIVLVLSHVISFVYINYTVNNESL